MRLYKRHDNGRFRTMLVEFRKCTPFFYFEIVFKCNGFELKSISRPAASIAILLILANGTIK
jgi:hypothetical protein